jgi:hypothetical protein
MKRALAATPATPILARLPSPIRVVMAHHNSDLSLQDTRVVVDGSSGIRIATIPWSLMRRFLPLLSSSRD